MSHRKLHPPVTQYTDNVGFSPLRLCASTLKLDGTKCKRLALYCKGDFIIDTGASL